MKNTGKCAGSDVVQLYRQDVTASLVRPVKELKGFSKIALEAGEVKNVKFTLKKQDMGFFDNEGSYRLESGLFRIYAGGNSRDCLEQDVMVSF